MHTLFIDKCYSCFMSKEWHALKSEIHQKYGEFIVRRVDYDRVDYNIAMSHKSGVPLLVLDNGEVVKINAKTLQISVKAKKRTVKDE